MQKLIIICWYGYCGYGKVSCDRKMGDPHGGPRCWKNTSLGYKWLQKLIIICCYGYCGYVEVDSDPKVGGGPPRGVLKVEKRLYWLEMAAEVNNYLLVWLLLIW